MKVRVLYKADKSVSVIHPVPKSRKKGETEEDWLKRVFAKSTPEGATYDDIDESELPDRATRMAWEGTLGKGVVVNTTKLQKVQEQKLHEEEISKKIAAKQRAEAIADLKNEGKLPADFTDNLSKL